MIGCILTGHGSFAPGLAGAVKMIAGPQEDFSLVPFTEEMDSKQFEMKLESEILSQVKKTEKILIFSDLLGGTPFKTAILLTKDLDNVEVISGTNLPILLEFLGSRIYQNNLSSLIFQLLSTGKDGINHIELKNIEENITTDNEGI